MKKGFTLSEVLITLGIIGVVATFTIPTLISNHRKQVAENKLKKFYSTINQAVILSENINGDKKYWDTIPRGYEQDENGEPDINKSKPRAWYDKYLGPYLKTVKVEDSGLSDGQVLAYFEDGSLAMISRSSITFFLEAKEFKPISKSDIDRKYAGIRHFGFQFFPNESVYPQHYNKGVEPYIPKYWDNTTESLLSDCNKDSHYKTTCTKLIQINGWKIPKDYPLKF